jgi:hypothetical protein
MLQGAFLKISEMPQLGDVSDEELGLEAINRILPDTWKNISWVITNGFQTLIDNSI